MDDDVQDKESAIVAGINQRAGENQLARLGQTSHIGKVSREHFLSMQFVGYFGRSGLQDHQYVRSHSVFIRANPTREPFIERMR